jgi:hypothetical protein
MLNFVKNMLKKKKNFKSNLDDNARLASIESRKQKAELRAIQHEIAKTKLEREKLLSTAKLNALEEKLFGTEEGNPEEQMLMAMLMPMLQKKAPQVADIFNNGQKATPENTSYSPPAKDSGVSLSEDVLQGYVAKIPKGILKQLKKLPDDDLRVKIIETIPDLSKDSVDKAILLIKN